jgi:hypothetical protein
VLDDLEGRRCTESLGIPVFGTVAVVPRAKRRGQIPSARLGVFGFNRFGDSLRGALDPKLRREG